VICVGLLGGFVDVVDVNPGSPTQWGSQVVTPDIRSPMSRTEPSPRSTSPMIFPSRRTTMRSESCITSSRSSEMMRMADPCDRWSRRRS